jgi:type I restriction enzyme, S subunit
MNSDWPELPFPEVVDFKEGPGIMARDFRDDSVPLIRVAGLSGSSSVLDGCNYLDSDKVEAKWSHFKLLPGDTLLSTSASLGRVALVGPEAEGAIPYTGIIRMRPRDSRLECSFIPYLLRGPHFQRQAEAMGSGSVLKHFGPGHLKQMAVIVPPVEHQRRIAWVLRSLDDKIDSNRRLAGLLEQLAATIFRARFVDFVGVEEFEESEIGLIPRGWTVAPIGEVLKVVGGSTPSTKESRYWDGGTHCWATPKDLAGARCPVLLETQRHITDEGVTRISSRLLPKRTVLLSSRAPVGYTAMSMVEISVNQGFIAIPPSASVPGEYVLFWLRENMGRIKRHAGGTTFAEISKRAFRPLLMLVPPAAALAAFERLAKPMFDLIAGVEREIAALSATRDLLLPRLISGEIRVPDTTDPDEVVEPAAARAAA